MKHLLLGNVPKNLVCTGIPQNVRSNCEFVISKQVLKNDRDVFSYGYGHSERSGTKGKLFGRNGDVILKIRKEEEHSFSETFTVTRVPAYFRGCKNFHRAVLFVPGSNYIYV